MRDKVRTIINSQLSIDITTMGRRVFLYQKKMINLLQALCSVNWGRTKFLCSRKVYRTY